MERFRGRVMNDPSFQADQQMVVNAAGFGEVNGVKLFDTWASRKDCCNSGVHRRTTAGISGSPRMGATSIVLSGGYPDDVDEGDIILYTGCTPSTREDSDSGEDGSSKRTSYKRSDKDDFHRGGDREVDQSFDHPLNAALKKNVENKRPVRVIRGPPRPGTKTGSVYATDPEADSSAKYRYDGLYLVVSAELVKGSNGYAICQFKLVRIKNQDTPPLPTRSYPVPARKNSKSC